MYSVYQRVISSILDPKMASKFVNDKLAKLKSCNCPCEPLSKICSFVIENDLVNKKNNNKNVEFGHSISLPERDKRISIVENKIDTSEKYSVSAETNEVKRSGEEIRDNTLSAR